MPAASESVCRNCGIALAEGSRFCPECGVRVAEDSGDTLVEELPPTDPAPSPMSVSEVSPRLFGVTPPVLLFALAAAALTASIVLLVLGSLVVGLVLLAAGALLAAFFLAEARRRPDRSPRLAHAYRGVVDSVRSRAGFAFEAVATHSSARLELVRIRRELSALLGERGARLRDLGEATYSGDRKAVRLLKGEIGNLDERIQAKEAEMTAVVASARERLEQAQQEAQPTQVVGMEEPGPPPDGPPQPATVPEPSPVPSQPVEPAVVPEPYPPPDEGDRPRQPEIPEPGPSRDE